MCERKNTILCDFSLSTSCISAYDIREWIYGQLCINDKVVTMAQIDEPKRHTHINFHDNGRMQDVLYSTGGQVEFRHCECEISAFGIITFTACLCHTMDNL